MPKSKSINRRSDLMKYTKFLNDSGILGVILLDVKKVVTDFFWWELEQKDINDINEGENF